MDTEVRWLGSLLFVSGMLELIEIVYECLLPLRLETF